MAESSAQQSAPQRVIKPASPQAARSQPGAPISREDSAEVMKMPDPIIEPMTMAVASRVPSPRTSFAADAPRGRSSGSVIGGEDIGKDGVRTPSSPVS